jgi:hypothetical protein
MKYATWKLNFTDPNYGTGPEDKIAELGFSAEGGWVDGQVEDNGTILGYVTGEPDAAQLTAWNFAYKTEAEALAFCQAINSEAFLAEDGRIGAPMEDLLFPTE